MSVEKLSESQKEEFGNWLHSRTQLIGKCAICGERKWVVLDNLLEVKPFPDESMWGTGPVYTYVGLMCSNCGNTHFLNAVLSGVLKDKNGSSPQSGGAGVD